MHVDLNGRWELRWTDSRRGTTADLLFAPDADMRRALPANVPGEAHLDLAAAGVIEEPLTGMNPLTTRWIEEMQWLYRRVFRAPAMGKGERAFLTFDRLELTAIIYLNGVQIATHQNAFRPLTVDVTPHLKRGVNTLVVALDAGLFGVADKPFSGYGMPDGGVKGPGADRLTKRHWLRQVQSSVGWDWSLRLLNVGITGGVRLESCRGVRVESFSAPATLTPDLSEGSVIGRAHVHGLEDRPQAAKLTVEIPELRLRVERTLEVKPGPNTLEALLRVPAPELWQPIGHGRQKRYAVRLTLRVNGRVARRAEKRAGFRHVRVNQDAHPESGRYFIIEVNGKPIFCKGGNFVPADPIPARLDQRRYATLVDRAVEANFNLLRVWGGGLYESEEFYDLCDERGILVWQEFIFACTKYPATDEAFLAEVKREAVWQVRRLAHRPSLIAWCGNNEIEQGHWHWGYHKGVAHPDYALYHMALPRIVREEDGTRYYQASSPISPDGTNPIADDRGDQHPWSVGFRNNDFRDYRKMICRFPNEGGVMGPTALPTVRAALGEGMDRIGSFAWELHDNSIARKGDQDRMIADWLGRSVDGMSLEEYVFYGGIVQGQALNEYIRNFRRRMFDSASAVFWMYNDCWPMIRSWTIVDYYLRRTPCFHPVRRAFAPLTAAIAHEAGRVKVFAINEGAETTVDCRYGLVALRGAYPLDRTVRVRLPANASTLIGEFDESQWLRLGERKHGAFAILSRGGREIAHETFFLPKYREMAWPKAKVKVRREGNHVVFTSDSFAWRVCLDLDGEKRLPDNFFDLLPGVPYALPWRAAWGEPKVIHLGNDIAG